MRNLLLLIAILIVSCDKPEMVETMVETVNVVETKSVSSKSAKSPDRVATVESWSYTACGGAVQTFYSLFDIRDGILSETCGLPDDVLVTHVYIFRGQAHTETFILNKDRLIKSLEQ